MKEKLWETYVQYDKWHEISEELVDYVVAGYRIVTVDFIWDDSDKVGVILMLQRSKGERPIAFSLNFIEENGSKSVSFSVSQYLTEEEESYELGLK